MFPTSTSGILLLQATTFFTGALGLTLQKRGGRCSGSCSTDDDLVRLLSSEDNQAEALSFCSDYIGLAASTAEATVTPTVFETITETDHIVVVTTQVNTITIAPVSSQAPAKRDENPQYPDWLPQSYPASRVSSACNCLSIPVSVVSNTVTAEAVTLTTAVTVTETDVSTFATETAIATVPKALGIQVFRKDTGASVGYLYWSNGPAITTTVTAAFKINFSLAKGTTYGEALRITTELSTDSALGVQMGTGYGSVQLVAYTPPNSLPVAANNELYASDIWTINTETKQIAVRWIGSDSSITYAPIWRVGGRVYPVTDLARFNSATGGVSSSKYEVTFQYFELP